MSEKEERRAGEYNRRGGKVEMKERDQKGAR